MATAMLAPFCLNYIFCFIAFFRLGKDKKKTFIFPLLNLYPQYGKDLNKLQIKSLFLIFQRLQD